METYDVVIVNPDYFIVITMWCGPDAGCNPACDLDCEFLEMVETELK